MQEHENTCGSAAIATTLNGFYNFNLSEKDVAEVLGAAAIDANILSKYLLDKGFKLEGKSHVKKLDFKDVFKYMPAPAIALLKRSTEAVGHWVVIRGMNPSYGVIVADPSFGNMEISVDDFKEQWMTEIDKKSGSPYGSIIIFDTPVKNASYFKEPKPYVPTRW